MSRVSCSFDIIFCQFWYLPTAWSANHLSQSFIGTVTLRYGTQYNGVQEWKIRPRNHWQSGSFMHSLVPRNHTGRNALYCFLLNHIERQWLNFYSMSERRLQSANVDKPWLERKQCTGFLFPTAIPVTSTRMIRIGLGIELWLWKIDNLLLVSAWIVAILLRDLWDVGCDTTCWQERKGAMERPGWLVRFMPFLSSNILLQKRNQLGLH